jgi:hypothetical protein
LKNGSKGLLQLGDFTPADPQLETEKGREQHRKKGTLSPPYQFWQMQNNATLHYSATVAE